MGGRSRPIRARRGGDLLRRRSGDSPRARGDTSLTPSFRLEDPEASEVAERVRRRVADRLARGILAPGEAERIASLPLRTVGGPPAASEAFRRCCILAEVDQAAPITSHRGLAGVPIVFAKRVLRRIFRFQTDPPLARQREFNRNLLLVVAALFDRREGPAGR